MRYPTTARWIATSYSCIASFGEVNGSPIPQNERNLLAGPFPLSVTFHRRFSTSAVNMSDSPRKTAFIVGKDSAASLEPVTTLLWFRKGLRLHDNPALLAACQDHPAAFREKPSLPQPPAITSPNDSSRASSRVHMCPIFVLDPWFLAPDPSAPSPGSTRVGINRIRFLLESLDDLNAQLEARGSRLMVLQGDPTVVIPRVIKEVGLSE